ncbi:MAG: hypothetical protein ABJB11_13685 [Ferruginibacter sp.]
MLFTRCPILLTLILLSIQSFSQDSLEVPALSNIPKKYFNAIDSKVDIYSSRIKKKTTKTLERLSRMETRIKGLLQKVSPETADKLFNPNQPTFSSILQQYKNGEALALSYLAPYNKYRDDLTTGLKYLEVQHENYDSSLIKKAISSRHQMEELNQTEDQSEVLQQFIKDRKKELTEQAIKYIGQSRYLAKINKEAYYYTTTLKNYKEIFTDSKKTEQTAVSMLNKIPAFKKFLQQNSQMASMFGAGTEVTGPANLTGLQTRQSIQDILTSRMGVGGPNVMQAVQQNLQQAQEQLDGLKNKLIANPLASLNKNGDLDMPDFKPNEQKSKTFKQRLDFGFNVQFAKNNTLLPTTSDISLTVGYKINDKSTIGFGGAYKVGMGTIKKIKFTHEGIGLRSYIEWKLKKQFFISGGYELNHNAQFKNIEVLKNYDAWQRSALIGLTKKLSVKSKWFKTSNIQILYDILSQQHVPVSQPLLFRVGYNF